MRTIYLILLFLWIAIGTFWSKRTFCPSTDKKKPSATSVAPVAATTGDCDRSLIFEDGDFSISSIGNLIFQANSTKFEKPKGELDEALTGLAGYLGENPSRSVLLEGMYFEKETNSSTKDNLGIGRAAVLKTHLMNEYGIDAEQLKIGGRLTTNTKCYYNADSKRLTKGIVATFGER